MNRIINKQKIAKITMKPSAYTRCELGGDFYKNEMEITFVPKDYYPDYTEVQDWAMKNLDGKTLNIEDVVDIIYDFLKDTYAPKELKIVNHVSGCRTHFDVVVEK